MIFKILLIVGLIKLLIEIDQPFLCSGIYAIGAFTLGSLFGNPVLSVAVASLIAFALASLYFWLLSKFPDGILWWVILIVGLPIALL